MARGRSRRAGLDDVRQAVADLWPAPHTVTTGGPRTGDALAFAVLPDTRRPTRLVPVSPGPVASQVLSAVYRGTGRRESTRRWLLTGAARAGLLRLAPAQVHVTEQHLAPSIAAQVGEVLGEPVCLGIHLGPPRANRKPVLQVVSRDGRTLGFAKVGTTALTRRLVAAEASALEAVAAADVSGLRVPTVRHRGDWRGLDVLLLDPVESRSTSALAAGRLGSVMAGLSLAWGHRSGRLADSVFWERLQAGAAAVGGPHAAQLRRAVAAADAAYGDRQVAFGAWHGDWTPWNMAVHEDGFVVWDWERFEQGVPLGLDAVHFHLQREMRRGREPVEVARDTLARVDELLRPWGLQGNEARCVFALYLLAIGSRYAADDQRGAGARLGDLDGWLFTVLEDVVVRDRSAAAVPSPAEGQ